MARIGARLSGSTYWPSAAGGADDPLPGTVLSGTVVLVGGTVDVGAGEFGSGSVEVGGAVRGEDAEAVGTATRARSATMRTVVVSADANAQEYPTRVLLPVGIRCRSARRGVVSERAVIFCLPSLTLLIMGGVTAAGPRGTG